MQHRLKRLMSRKGFMIVCTFLWMNIFFSVTSAHALKTKVHHTVQKGESVASICDHYGVAQRDFLEINGLGKGRPLKLGQEVKIPNVLRVSGKRYTVKAGDTLASIAAKYKRSAKELSTVNKLDPSKPLPLGRILVIPDSAESSKKIAVDEDGPASILFLRIRTGERERLNLYSKSGNVIYKSVRQLSYLSRDIKANDKTKRLHYRLVKMIQEVADKFPGKPIEIISGYRTQAGGNESQHAFGRALDFRMPGVSCKALFNFCKTLKHAGCGYYPNDGFVHMDARTQRASWIDRSKGKASN